MGKRNHPPPPTRFGSTALSPKTASPVAGTGIARPPTQFGPQHAGTPPPPRTPPSTAVAQPMMRRGAMSVKHLLPNPLLISKATYFTAFPSKTKPTQRIASQLADSLSQGYGPMGKAYTPSAQNSEVLNIVAEHSDLATNQGREEFLKKLGAYPVKSFKGVVLYSCLSADFAKFLSTNFPDVIFVGSKMAVVYQGDSTSFLHHDESNPEKIIHEPVSHEVGMKALRAYRNGAEVALSDADLLKAYMFGH